MGEQHTAGRWAAHTGAEGGGVALSALWARCCACNEGQPLSWCGKQSAPLDVSCTCWLWALHVWCPKYGVVVCAADADADADAACVLSTYFTSHHNRQDIERGAVDTQLIAHDREVYDIAWGGVGVFATVSADGSVRVFDLR